MTRLAASDLTVRLGARTALAAVSVPLSAIVKSSQCVAELFGSFATRML